jgi:hypothetical protein
MRITNFISPVKIVFSLFMSTSVIFNDNLILSNEIPSCNLLFNDSCSWDRNNQTQRCVTSVVVIIPSIIISNCTALGVARNACRESAQRRSFLRQQWSRMSRMFTDHANARMLFLFGDLDMLGNPLPPGDILQAQVRISTCGHCSNLPPIRSRYLPAPAGRRRADGTATLRCATARSTRTSSLRIQASRLRPYSPDDSLRQPPRH